MTDRQEIRHTRSVYIYICFGFLHCAVVSSLEYFEDGLCVALWRSVSCWLECAWALQTRKRCSRCNMAVRRGWSLQLYISAWAKQWAWAILKQFWSGFLYFQSTRKQTVIDSYDQISFFIAFNNLSERVKLRSPTPSRVLFWKSGLAAIKKELDIFAI